MMNKTSTSSNLRMTVNVALFTALTIIGGYISIPIPVGPVPIVLTDFFVMVTGLFLGYKWGSASVGLYLGLGALGLPVFAGGRSGLAILVGPTGGFLLGYLLVALSIGLVSEKIKTTSSSSMLVKNIAALIVGNVFLYLAGVPWLKVVANMTWPLAIASGFLPFIVGIIIKIAVAAALAQALLPRFKQTTAPVQRNEE